MSMASSSPFSDLPQYSLSTPSRRYKKEEEKQNKHHARRTTSKEPSINGSSQNKSSIPPPPSPRQKSNDHSVSFFHCRPSSVIPSLEKEKHRYSNSDDIGENEWRFVATELSKKLLVTARKRDEAISEASRLKHSISELKHELATRTNHSNSIGSPSTEQFLRSVSSARSAVRLLARTLSSHARQFCSPSTLIPHHMESLLNRVFYVGFELLDEDEILIADPSTRCEMNRSEYELLHGLTWDEVLYKGTRYYSDRLSRFCDRKMSEVVGSLGWAPSVWPEEILRAFFGAARSAWVVRLLARSVHPPVPILRVDKGALFDPKFMEDVKMDRTGLTKPVESVRVKLLVAPGFHVYSSDSCVVKCKVLCSYKGHEGKLNGAESFRRRDGKRIG
ncbi:hypothetical protein LUZ60_016139 [Juncus effusus]|nr:hypothetical protein LUZ60_016139 [Juncus effusus]